jgi:hypothetical protein
MTRIHHDPVDEVIDGYIAQLRKEQEQDHAFGEALRALFEQYDPPFNAREVGSARSTAVRSAQGGAYRIAFYPQEKAVSWWVPSSQLVAIHALIYG